MRSPSLVFSSLPRHSITMFLAKLAALSVFGLSYIVSNAAGAIVEKRAAAFFNPADGGGSMFIDAGNGLGEPLNVRQARILIM